MPSRKHPAAGAPADAARPSRYSSELARAICDAAASGESSYADELDEYEGAVAKALAHDGGAAILDLAPADRLALVGPRNVPEGNFGSLGGG